MRIQIVAKSLRCEQLMEEHIRRRVHFALGRFMGTIHGVQIHLFDENGPRGGEDKRCRTIVTWRKGEPLVAESRGSDLTAVIDESIQRAGRAMGRAVNRRFNRLDLGRNLWPSVHEG